MQKCIIFLFISIINVASFANSVNPVNSAHSVNEPLSFIFKSPHNLSETVERVQKSIKAKNYRVYAPKNLLAGLAFGEDTSKQVVLRFCNFEKMYEFMQIEKRLGVVLPCRITVIEDDNTRVSIVIENYARTVKMFNNPQISKEAKVINEELKELIEEALW